VQSSRARIEHGSRGLNMVRARVAPSVLTSGIALMRTEKAPEC